MGQKVLQCRGIWKTHYRVCHDTELKYTTKAGRSAGIKIELKNSNFFALSWMNLKHHFNYTLHDFYYILKKAKLWRQ